MPRSSDRRDAQPDAARSRRAGEPAGGRQHRGQRQARGTARWWCSPTRSTPPGSYEGAHAGRLPVSVLAGRSDRMGERERCGSERGRSARHLRARREAKRRRSRCSRSARATRAAGDAVGPAGYEGSWSRPRAAATSPRAASTSSSGWRRRCRSCWPRGPRRARSCAARTRSSAPRSTSRPRGLISAGAMTARAGARAAADAAGRRGDDRGIVRRVSVARLARRPGRAARRAPDGQRLTRPAG